MKTTSPCTATGSKIFYGGTGDLEFVHIEKIRIDGNRAYLRGSLKYSYANMNEGSFGWFPLENLIKLRGRWLWFGHRPMVPSLTGMSILMPRFQRVSIILLMNAAWP